MAKRNYSDEEKAQALAVLTANAGNVKLTASQLNIPWSTLADWSKGHGLNESITEKREVKKQDLADRLEEVAHKLVDAIPDKIKDASLQHVSVSVGIAVEKMRLLREQATSISGNDLTDDERLARLNALYERVRSRGVRPVGEANGKTIH